MKTNFQTIATAVMLVFVGFSSAGCATIVSGTTQKVAVTSNPSDASAKADNTISMKTPATFVLDRKNDHSIEISKDGYKTTTIFIKRTFNGAAAGNILLGGIIGGGIDMATGSSNKLVPERIDVVLEEGSGYSDVPKFASQKDAEYYEKNIVKLSKVEENKDQKTIEPAIAIPLSNIAPGNKPIN